MSLLGIQTRFREQGRIRLGERVTKGGKTYPQRLQTFRLTSSDRVAIDAAAAKYGGMVEKWETGWEVITEVDRLEVMLPPTGTTEPYSLWYELWSGGGIQRRCDGTDAMIGGVDGQCLCDPEARQCEPTLRVSFLLPDLPGLGTWRLESKSYNAAAELPGTLNLLAMYAEQNRPVRGILRIEQRQVKRDGQTKIFNVPVLDPVGTINTLLAAVPAERQLPPVRPDELPLLPHELDGAAVDREPSAALPIEQPASPAAGETEQPSTAVPVSPDPPDPDGREASGDTTVVPSSGEADHSDELPGVTSTAATTPGGQLIDDEVARWRYAWAEQKFGIAADDLENRAVAATGETPMTMEPAQWRAFALALTAGALEPEPPKPRTDEYRALSQTGKANARAYWEQKDKAQVGA